MADPFYSTDKLLTAFEADFSDAIGHAVTVNGSPAPTVVSSSPAPPSGAAASGAFIAADSQYLTYGSSSDFNTGTGDFTAEAFYYLVSRASYRTIIGKGGGIGANTGWGILTSGGADVFGEVNAQSVNIFGGAAANTLNAWHHAALVRASGVWSLYLDGSRIGTSSNQGSSDVGGTDPLNIGFTASGGQYWDGNISYARISKGLARYTGASFAVPTIPTDFQAPVQVPFTPWPQLAPILAQ